MTFAIDVDGVLRDLFHSMVNLYNKECHENLAYEDLTTWTIYSYKKLYDELGADGTRDWFFQKHSKDLFLNSPLISPDIPYMIKKLRQYGKVTIVTWQRTDENKFDTINWLTKNNIEYDDIFFSKDKTDIQCDYMIDDRYDYIAGSLCKYGALINAPYNKHLTIDDKRCKRYDSILDFISKFLDEQNFNPAAVKGRIVHWLRDWFSVNGQGCKAVIGASGGKDSFIISALCAEALGKENVLMVGMPDYGQSLNDADKQADYLGVKYITAPISGATAALKDMLLTAIGETSVQTEQNLPPRLRMATLYAISQTVNGRVLECGNASENYIGYATRWGDNVGDVSPLGNLTVTEVRAIGHAMGLPDKWVYKTPDDGLPHSTSDEEKIGFTYETLDRYIRGIEVPELEIKAKIDAMHNKNSFKLKPIPTFLP